MYKDLSTLHTEDQAGCCPHGATCIGSPTPLPYSALMGQRNFPPFVNGAGRKLGTTSRTSHMTHVINTASLNNQAMQTVYLGHCKGKVKALHYTLKYLGTANYYQDPLWNLAQPAPP